MLDRELDLYDHVVDVEFVERCAAWSRSRTSPTSSRPCAATSTERATCSRTDRARAAPPASPQAPGRPSSPSRAGRGALRPKPARNRISSSAVPTRTGPCPIVQRGIRRVQAVAADDGPDGRRGGGGTAQRHGARCERRHRDRRAERVADPHGGDDGVVELHEARRLRPVGDGDGARLEGRRGIRRALDGGVGHGGAAVHAERVLGAVEGTPRRAAGRTRRRVRRRRRPRWGPRRRSCAVHPAVAGPAERTRDRAQHRRRSARAGRSSRRARRCRERWLSGR